MNLSYMGQMHTKAYFPLVSIATFNFFWMVSHFENGLWYEIETEPSINRTHYGMKILRSKCCMIYVWKCFRQYFIVFYHHTNRTKVKYQLPCVVPSPNAQRPVIAGPECFLIGEYYSWPEVNSLAQMFKGKTEPSLPMLFRLPCLFGGFPAVDPRLMKVLTDGVNGHVLLEEFA